MKEEIFTMEEAAKWCGLNPKSMYMRYRRGQIENIKDLNTHRIYFTRSAIEEFRSKYVPFVTTKEQ